MVIDPFIQQADDPSQVIEEAKALAAQSLASVTYQVNSLASALLKLLDSQAMQMNDMESSVNLISLVSSTFPTLIHRVQPPTSLWMWDIFSFSNRCDVLQH